MSRLVFQLAAWRTEHRRTAWKPVLGEGDGEVDGSRLGGTPWLSAAEAWPACGTCKKPMQLFLQLQTATLPHEAQGRYGDGLIQLFYCVNERAMPEMPGFPVPALFRSAADACSAADWEPFSPAHLVRLVSPSSGGRRGVPPKSLRPFPSRPITSWEPFADGPEANEHELLGLHRTYDFAANTMRVTVPDLGIDQDGLSFEAIDAVDDDCRRGEKLGGWPRWVQNIEYPACPKCAQPMAFVFQLDSRQGLPFMFGDVGRGHLTQCPTHRDVLAFSWAGS